MYLVCVKKGSDFFYQKTTVHLSHYLSALFFSTTPLFLKKLNKLFKKNDPNLFSFPKHILAHLKLLSNNVLLYLFGKFEIFCFCSVFVSMTMSAV